MPDTSRMKPEFAVHLDGKKLQGEEAGAILGIRVYQTRGGASSFELVISDPELRWQAKPTFIDCKEVKIDLGVPGRLKTVFDGEVTAWRTELERSGPSVLVLRGLDRSHRMMRGHKTRTYPNATPLDVAAQIATQYGLTAKTRAGTPAPVKAFRFQANQSDYEFLAQLAQREGYVFWVEGSDLHFERPQVPTTDDCEFAFGENLKTFLPSADFRKPPASVEVSGWDAAGKAKVAATATKGQGLWTVPGGKPGADVAAFTQTKVEKKVVDSHVTTRAEAETVAKAALTRQSMEFLTGEVEVQGDPSIKPGALVNLKKVGAYSGHYLVNEANHFYDPAGYHCIFYVARDKWGNSSAPAQQGNAAKRRQAAATAAQNAAAKAKAKQAASKAAQVVQEGIHRRLVDEHTGEPFADTDYEVTLHGGEKRRGKTDAQGYMREEDVPKGNFTVRVLIEGPERFAPDDVDIEVDDPDDARVHGQHDTPNHPIESALVSGISGVAVAPPRLFQGDTVSLSANIAGADDETTVVFRIFRVADSAPVGEVTARILHGEAKATFEVPDSPSAGKQDGFDYADFDVEVECAAMVGRAEEVPAFRAFAHPETDAIHRRLVDEDTGEPMGGTRYELTLDDGEVRQGRTDDDGYFLEEDVPPGTFTIVALGDEPDEAVAEEVELDVEDPDDEDRRAPSLDETPDVEPELAEVAIEDLAVSPSRLFEGDRVHISARISAADGEQVAFRIFEISASEPLAEIQASLSSGAAACEWTAQVGAVAGSEEGVEFGDFDVEVECCGEVVRAPDLPTFRVFRGGTS